MRFAGFLASALVLSLMLPASARAQDGSFESLIEGILGRGQGEQAPPPYPPPAQYPAPAPGQYPQEAPGQYPPPAAGQYPPESYPGQPEPQGQGSVPPNFNPVELGPRPYTPPKIERKPEDEAAAPPAMVFPAPPPPDAAAPPADGAAAPPPADSAAGAAPASPEGAAGSAAQPGPEQARTRESLTVEEVNGAAFPETLPPFNGADPLVLKAQILLDRAGASPGAVDAYSGGNLRKAVSAVETVLGLPVDGVLDRKVWDALGGDDAPPPLVAYTITAEDLAYPFSASIPQDYAEQARLPNLNYTSPEEMLAERFHMDVKLLRALNPNADFRAAGTEIWVASVDGTPITGKVARIVADKAQSQVRGYDSGNRLLVAYPATIGSEENPSPSGDHQVSAVAPDPVYYYDPGNFVQGSNTQPLELPPGPNNPVGSVWIDLSEPTYGIHGTPEPTTIGKAASHGCIRLTNWDAKELAGLVSPGVVVSFQ